MPFSSKQEMKEWIKTYVNTVRANLKADDAVQPAEVKAFMGEAKVNRIRGKGGAGQQRSIAIVRLKYRDPPPP